MRLAILSNTRIPGRVGEIPSWVEATVCETSPMIHAGDLDSPAALDRLHDLSARFVDVSGDVDLPSIDLLFVEIVGIDRLMFIVTHGMSTRTGYESRAAKTVRDAANVDAVGVAGHIHEVVDEVVDDIRVFSPGTATATNPGNDATMVADTVTDGSVSVEIVRDD